MKPILKLYRGYCNGQELVIMGHLLGGQKRDEYDFQKKDFRNARAIIRLFMVRTLANIPVCLHYNNRQIHTKTLEDGYFKFCIPLKERPPFGWNSFRVSTTYQGETSEENGSFLNPHSGKWGIISDIDDTFMVSHSNSFWKKLYVLLFRNLESRKLFEDVAPHYTALSRAGRTNDEEANAFFYVSSSEWNLYRFIRLFTELHDLPKAVLLLKDIKSGIGDFLGTGRGDHNHKFVKIQHLLEFYPDLKFVLLGDDSQQDPVLYQNLCKIFPVTIKAVYIRQTGKEKDAKTERLLNNIKTLNVETCYFRNSSEAIAHSRAVGITEGI